MVVLGIDIGGHTIKAGIVNNNGKIIKKYVIETETNKGKEKVLQNINGLIDLITKNNPEIKKIGIGFPGTIDKKGNVKYSPNIPFSNINLKKELKTTKKLFFGNDADNFALGTYTLELKQKYKNIIALTLGTGIGSGVIVEGKLFSHNGAPELGHTTIKFDSNKSKCCNNNGCLESFIGTKNLDEEPKETYKKAIKGDKIALKKFQKYGKYLGIAISNFANIFNPELIILGGEVSNAYPFFKKSMEKEIKIRALFMTKVIKSKINDKGIIGAAALCFKE